MKNIKFLLCAFFLAIPFAGRTQATDTLKIVSKVFSQTRKVKVVLPDGYNKYPNTEVKYPVAYLFDSQSDDFFNFYKTTIHYLTENGYMQPVILVGIASANRQFEFTPKAQTEAGLKSFRKSGGADSLALHLSDEVMPLVNSKYRSLPYNIGIGHSLGGTFVTYALLMHPEIFNAVIAVSPNFHYDNEQIVHKFDSLANSQLLSHKYLYIAHGAGDDYEDDFKIGTEKIHALLIKKNISGLRWEVKSMDNDSHGTTAMEGIFKGLVALNKNFSLTDTQLKEFGKNNKVKPFMESIKDYYQSSSAWAKIQVPNVDVINNLGYNFFYQKNYKIAIDVFTWGLSLYPTNINLYDSMGEIQQNADNKQAALLYYNKGIALIKSQKGTLPPETYNKLIKDFNARIKNIDVKKF